MSRLETRDLEILRTLARLHFVTSSLLNAYFFPSDSVGFRRLQALAERDFIRRHTKGIPQYERTCDWRISPHGIGRVRREFKQEPIPEGLDDRLCEYPLVNLEHREALSRVYLALVGGERGLRGEGAVNWSAVQLWLAAVLRRVERFTWRSGGTVILRWREEDGEHRITPDVLIESKRPAVRVFLEVERLARPFSRIEERFARYARFLRCHYAAAFPDKLTPWVVYLARSDQRWQSLTQLGRTHLEGVCQWHVGRHPEGASWLAELLFTEHRDAVTVDPADRFRAVACDLLHASNALLDSGELDAVARARPELIDRWHKGLHALYDLVEEQAGRERQTP